MKRVWVALVLVAVFFAAGFWYFHGAWSVAREWAVSAAAGDSDLPLNDNVWALGRDLPHDQLIVITGPGWRQPSDQLAIDFTVHDSSSSRTAQMRVTVQFGWDGWSVIGG